MFPKAQKRFFPVHQTGLDCEYSLLFSAGNPLEYHCASPQAVVVLAHMSTSTGGPMESVLERRAARRFSMMLPLKVRYGAGEEVTEKSAETRDVSFRGLYFLIEANLENGSSIEFVLTLPQQITLAGDVHIR
jgi:hypothetical protein